MVPTTTTFFVCLLVLHVSHARPRELQLISDRLTKNMRRAASYQMGYLFGKRSEPMTPVDTSELIQNLPRPHLSSLMTDFLRRKIALAEQSHLNTQNTKEPDYLLN